MRPHNIPQIANVLVEVPARHDGYHSEKVSIDVGCGMELKCSIGLSAAPICKGDTEQCGR